MLAHVKAQGILPPPVPLTWARVASQEDLWNRCSLMCGHTPAGSPYGMQAAIAMGTIKTLNYHRRKWPKHTHAAQ